MKLVAVILMIWCMGLSAAAPAMAQGATQDTFDAGLLSPGERRILQAALALSGDYVGMLDGQWGRGSQRALEAYSLRTFGTRNPMFRQIVPLLVSFESERRIRGWRNYHEKNYDVSFAEPFGWVESDFRKAADGVFEYRTPTDDFTYFVRLDTSASVQGLHQRIRTLPKLAGTPYVVDEKDHLVTAVRFVDGGSAYMRSFLTPRGAITVAINAAHAHRTRLALMAASIRRGPAPDLRVPRDGLLWAIMGAPAVAEPEPAPAPQPLPAPTPPAAKASASPPPAPPSSGSGTGFYVSGDSIVTAAHVVAGCGRVALADGTTLTVLHSDKVLDLAVLKAPRRSPVWIGVATTTQPRLGEQVTAVGYPFLGTLGQGLTVTGGNVSAMQGINGTSDRIMISAPVQPGNSGGPLLNGRGQVIGVVVSRVNDLNILKVTGSLPQNMNFAVPVGSMSDVLSVAAVGAQSDEEYDLASGLPDAVAAAVVPVLCNP